MPQVCILLQVIPFGVVHGGDSDANVAAERLAAWVMRRALLAAIERGDGCIEACIQFAEIYGLETVTGHGG